MDILEEIYRGEYSIDSPKTQEYHKILSETADQFDRIRAIAGGQMTDQLWSANAQLTSLESYHSFLAGLRLGMAVMREYCQ